MSTTYVISETRDPGSVPVDAGVDGTTVVYVCRDSGRRTSHGPVALREIRGQSIKTTLDAYARGEVEGLSDDELGWLTAYTSEEWECDGGGVEDTAVPFVVRH